ncbi:MAG: MFS transporter, partial [Phenylobacterium sp.]
MVFTALKSVMEEYGRPATVGWLVTSYLLMSAASSAICGRLGDLFGRRTVLLTVLGLAGAGSVVSALSPSLEGVILGRFLQGFSGALLPLTIGLTREHVPQKHLAISIGVVSAASAAGGGLGMLLGGVLIDQLGWRSIFWASSGFVIVSVTAAMLFIPRSRSGAPSGSLDFIGGLLFVPAVAGALLALSNAREWQVDLRFWGLLAASAALFAVWVWHELRHPNPLIEVRLLANPRIALPNAAMGLCALGAFNFAQLLLLMMQQPVWTGVGLGLSATLAGLIKLPGNFIASAVSPVFGWACDRFTGGVVAAAGMGLSALCCLVVAAWPENLPLLAITVTVMTVATATVYVAVPGILVQVAPPSRTSETIGMFSVIRSLSQAVGAQVMLVLLATSTVRDPNGGPAVFPSLSAYQLTLGVLAATCLASALVALRFPRVQSAPSTAAPVKAHA